MSKDNVNSPSHYTQAGIECIDASTAAVSGKSGIEAVCVANIIKYLWRYELKNGVEDVKKAQWYLNRLVAELESKPDPKNDICDHEWYDEFPVGSAFYGKSVCRRCLVMK